MNFVTERLAGDHCTASFDSGKPELDMWLRESASHAEQHRTSRTFVWHAGDHVVVAYYSLAAHLLTREAIGSKIGRGSPHEIPAVLLARLALTRSLHGQGLGGALLGDALGRAARAAEQIAARFVVVDAVDDHAADFYEKYEFRRVPGDSHRLVRKMSSIAADLGYS